MLLEIGNALLQRYEAVEKKHAFEVKRLNLQVSPLVSELFVSDLRNMKRSALYTPYNPCFSTYY